MLRTLATGGESLAHTRARARTTRVWLVACGVDLDDLDQPWDIRETGDGVRDSSSAPPVTRLRSARQFHSIAGVLRLVECSNCSSYTMSNCAYLSRFAVAAAAAASGSSVASSIAASDTHPAPPRRQCHVPHSLVITSTCAVQLAKRTCLSPTKTILATAKRQPGARPFPALM